MGVTALGGSDHPERSRPASAQLCRAEYLVTLSASQQPKLPATRYTSRTDGCACVSQPVLGVTLTVNLDFLIASPFAIGKVYQYLCQCRGSLR
jgi:hypothetical protein